MSIWLAKVSRGGSVGLIPTDDESRSELERMGDGECKEFTIISPRSVQWHRKYFGTCTEIGKNQDPPRDKDSIDRELRILAGHYDVMKLRDKASGTVYDVLTPKRIAFDKMTAEQWAEYYKKGEPEWIARFGEEYWLEANAA